MSRSYRPVSISALTLVLLIPSACTWGLGNREPETNEMHRRFSRTVDIQTGVVLSDLSRARSGAAWLAGHEEIQGNGQGSSEAAEIRGYASLIAQASDLDSVAHRVGRMAAACGSCHTATGGGPRFVVGSGAPESDSPADQMIRHLWAADRMWEGLVGPSEDTWTAGARALTRSAAAGNDLFRASSASPATEGYLSRIRALGQEAELARTLEARASVYGELLNTCRGCHESAGVMVEG